MSWVPLDPNPQSPFPLIDYAGEDLGSIPTTFDVVLSGGTADDESVEVDFTAQVALHTTAGLNFSTKSKRDRTRGGLHGEVTVSTAEKPSYKLQVGCGYEIYFTWTDVKASAEVDTVAQAALAADGGLANTSYAIEVYGMNSREMLPYLPRPGLLGAAALRQLTRSLNGLVRSMNRKKNSGGPSKDGDPDPTALTGDFAPSPRRIFMTSSLCDLAIRKSLEVVFAADQIRRGIGLENALTNLSAVTGIDATQMPTPSGVERVYDLWGAKDTIGPSVVRAATAWLSTTIDQDAVEDALVGGLAGSGSPPPLHSAARTLRRVIARSQLVEADASLDFKFGAAVTGGSTLESKNLVYNLEIEFLETNSGAPSYSGVELRADILKSNTEIQGSFAQIKAAVELGVSKAKFNLAWEGLGPNLGAQLLGANDFDTKELEAKLDEVDKGIDALKDGEVSPTSRPFVWATSDYDVRSFPSARTVYLIMNRLAHLTDDLTGGSIVAGTPERAAANLRNVKLATSHVRVLTSHLGCKGPLSPPGDRQKLASVLDAVAPWK